MSEIYPISNYGKLCHTTDLKLLSLNLAFSDHFLTEIMLFWLSTSIHKNNDKFYPKVAFLMYKEMVNFRPQTLKAASKQKPHQVLGTRLPSS